MKVRRVLKQISVFALIGTILATDITPAYAATSVAGVNETQDVSTDDTAECEVYAELGSNFLVTIPKKITLDGSTKKGSYTVDVEGDIAGTDVVKVVPDPSVALSSKNLADVTASISQDKTQWSYSEILADSKVTGNGAIDATGITAGSWNGTFNFNVGLENTGTGESGSETPEIEYTEFTLTADNYSQVGITRSGDVVIPETFEYDGVNYKLTSIGDYAFYECTSLTSVTIPDSVTSIGSGAFGGCTNLASVTIGKEVTNIGEGVYEYGVDSITADAFYNCTSLTNISVNPNNASYCSVDGVLFSKDMITLNYYPAGKTDSAYTIPNSVNNIDYSAFDSCKYLINLTIPDSVTSIGLYAFDGCSNLTNVTFKNTSGWCVLDTHYWDATEISNSDLEDTSTAAKYLKSTYCWNVWTRE